MTRNQRNAYRIADELGLRSGWYVFNVDSTNRYQVQKLDEPDLLPDDGVAIKLARAAGVKCDDDGWVL
jgi:hypothetical protein